MYATVEWGSIMERRRKDALSWTIIVYVVCGKDASYVVIVATQQLTIQPPA